jgi:hypothetical protein
MSVGPVDRGRPEGIEMFSSRGQGLLSLGPISRAWSGEIQRPNAPLRSTSTTSLLHDAERAEEEAPEGGFLNFLSIAFLGRSETSFNDSWSKSSGWRKAASVVGIPVAAALTLVSRAISFAVGIPALTLGLGASILYGVVNTLCILITLLKNGEAKTKDLGMVLDAKWLDLERVFSLATGTPGALAASLPAAIGSALTSFCLSEDLHETGSAQKNLFYQNMVVGTGASIMTAYIIYAAAVLAK